MQLANNEAAGIYNEACEKYADTEVDRTNNLNNMQKIINRLLKKGNTAIATQTEPVEGIESLKEILMIAADAAMGTEDEQDAQMLGSSQDANPASDIVKVQQAMGSVGTAQPSSRFSKPIPN